ncbi:hypothetical protein FZEAL_5557 [Fusarium zealandicum]|uniref:Amidoligase enzyme n=1 Tax=Fusarium zealandicum TaxID=1053134 RepID=A0A8H4UJL2_9HYPO|nr:hypothetical protein FZEAL_5557 [Fusarium zealandicum]
MPSPTWQGITFGIELEFMTPCPNTKALWRASAPAAAARLHIAELLARQTSLPVACKCTHPESDACCICHGAMKKVMYNDVYIVSPLGVQVAPGSQLENNYFLLTTEFLDSRHPLNVTRNWPGVEISTPIFLSGELRAGLPTVKTVLDTLRNSADTEITADESCGLHVHVGVESGMNVVLAKKIITLVMLLEDTLLLRLVSPTRLGNDYARPINQSSAVVLEPWPISQNDEGLNSHVPPAAAIEPGLWNNKNPQHLHRVLEKLWSAPNLQELSRLIRKETISRCALALSLRDHSGKSKWNRLSGSFENTPTTIEFRYAQMSFDIQFLRNWVEVVARIVELAQAGPAGFKKCFSKICEIQYKAGKEGKPAWEMLLKSVLNLGHRVPEWQNQFAKYKRGEVFSHLDNNMLLRPL